MAGWVWVVGFAFAFVLWMRVRRGRKASSTNLLAGSSRDMLGRGGF